MKKLHSITMTGGAFSRGFFTPGWNTAAFTDGTTLYLKEGGIDSSVAECERQGIDCTDYKARLAEASKPFKPSEAEESAELYQHHYSYEKPVALCEWSFSYTFGRWSRLVTFADGWHGYTYPKR